MLPYILAGAAGLALLGVGATRRKKHHRGDPRTAETQRLRIVDARHAKTMRMARVNPKGLIGVDSEGIRWSVKKNAETKEWMVVAYVNGKRDEDKTYYTDDREDAVGTFDHLMKTRGGTRTNPNVLEHIRAGDRITIVTPHGQRRTGRAVMRGPAGWVLNLGGAHGTPGIATNENIVKIVPNKNRRNPRIDVKVTAAGNTWVTGFNGTPEEAKKYFLGQIFNVGTGHGGDRMARVTKVEVLKSNPKRRGKVKRTKVRREVNGKWKTATTVTRTVKKVLTNPSENRNLSEALTLVVHYLTKLRHVVRGSSLSNSFREGYMDVIETAQEAKASGDRSLMREAAVLALVRMQEYRPIIVDRTGQAYTDGYDDAIERLKNATARSNPKKRRR